jgi:hypothetical protein
MFLVLLDILWIVKVDSYHIIISMK